MYRICTWSRTNGVSFCSKDCFYAFYKLGNAPKSVLGGPHWGSLQRSLRPLAGGEGASHVLPKNPIPSSAFRVSAIQAMLCRPPTPPPKKNKSWLRPWYWYSSFVHFLSLRCHTLILCKMIWSSVNHCCIAAFEFQFTCAKTLDKIPVMSLSVINTDIWQVKSTV